MKYPESYRYTREHEWIHLEGDIGTVGITHYAQEQLGDIVYIELPAVGQTFRQLQAFGTIESVKTAADLYMPMSGEVIEVNQEVVNHPEIVNQSPHERGWLVRIRVHDLTEFDRLMSPQEYEAYVEPSS